MQGMQDSKGNKGRKKQAGRKKRENRKAIVTREGRIPDNYGCICWKKRAETGNEREKLDWRKRTKRKGREKPALYKEC